MDYVTNGVHVPTFLHPEWSRCFDRHLASEWRDKLLDVDYWQGINDIPDSNYWARHQTIKSQMIDEIKRRVLVRAERTVTLALPKTGLVDAGGELYLADIGIPPEVYRSLGLSFQTFWGDHYWLRLVRGDQAGPRMQDA